MLASEGWGRHIYNELSRIGAVRETRIALRCAASDETESTVCSSETMGSSRPTKHHLGDTLLVFGSLKTDLVRVQEGGLE
ncbi:hypothetical protein Hanom_Chr14g01286511 [Helianthus anomalus]